MRRAATILAAIGALGALSGVGAYQMAPLRTERATPWREIAWPFARDGWPAGRAFRCDGAACEGAEFYVRPKLGFCNCDRGVADDDEVDRVTDIDLISPHFAAVAPGDRVRIGEMHGRARHYEIDMPDGARHAATGIAVARRCDLLVVVAQGRGEAATIEAAVLGFLASPEMKTWMIAALDRR